MKCPSCGTENDPSDQFCGFCGGRLAPSADTVRCPNCGFENLRGDAFCGGCGQPLSGPERERAGGPTPVMPLILLSAALLICSVVIYFCFGPLSRQDDRIEEPDETPARETAEVYESAPAPAETPRPTATPEPPLTAELYSGALVDYSRRINLENAYASSELTWEGQLFPAKNAIDGTIDTSWQEGVYGFGEGEYLHLVFANEETVDYIQIWPTYGKGTVGFSNNNRICDAYFEFSDGSGFTVSFPDEYSWFTLELSRPVRSEYLRVTILSVYPGAKYDDTVISEVALFTR